MRTSLFYDGYQVQCESVAVADGRFDVQVSIALRTGRVLLEKRLSQQRDQGSEQAAVAHATKWGKAWIDDNG